MQNLKKKTSELRNEIYAIISEDGLGDFENSLTEIEKQLINKRKTSRFNKAL